MEGLRGTLIQVVPLAAALIFLAVVLRKKGRTREDLALLWPRPLVVLGWLVGWAAWIAITELINLKLGLHEADDWRARYAPPIIALRVVGVVLLAPIVEELIFRGLFLPRLATTRLGAGGAIAVVAAAFGAMHFVAGPYAMFMAFLDGCLFGAARLRTRSLLLPMLLHMTGNLYAAVERLL